jgi:hypothetical protein
VKLLKRYLKSSTIACAIFIDERADEAQRALL